VAGATAPTIPKTKGKSRLGKGGLTALAAALGGLLIYAGVREMTRTGLAEGTVNGAVLIRTELDLQTQKKECTAKFNKLVAATFDIPSFGAL